MRTADDVAVEGGSLDGLPVKGRPDEPAAQAALPAGLDRLRLLAATGMGTVLVSYGLIVAIAAAVVLGSGGELGIDGAFALAAPLWLAAHQVPLVLDGVPLSMLPLLPTMGLGVLIAFGAGAAARQLGARSPTDLGPVVATVAGSHGMVAVLVSAVLPPAGAVAVAPWAALLAGVLTAGVSATFGALRVCGAPPSWDRLPGWLRVGLRAAGAGLAALATCAAMLLLAGLLASADQVHELIAAPGNTGAAVGLTVLSVIYLPNALVASMCWLLGPGFGIGAAAASPFGAVPQSLADGQLPGVPLLAAVPVNPPPGWAWLIFVLPVLVGGLVGSRCRATGSRPADRLRAAGVAAAGIAFGVGLLATMAGGRLAAGPFDPVTVPALAAAGAALAWTVVPAVVVASYGPRQAELLTAARRVLRLSRSSGR